MASSLPNWVSEKTVLRAIQNFKKDKTIEIIDIFTKNAVSVGENYTSDLLRTTVKYRSQNLLSASLSNNIETMYLVIKCEGDSIAKKAFAQEIYVFKVETNMFSVTIPKLNSILGGSTIAAECLLSKLNPLGIIILQDLAPVGYKMADRHKGLDYDHCLVTLEKLAQMHAASAVLFQKDASSMDPYFAGLFTNQHKNKVIEEFVMTGFNSAINALCSWTGYEKYGKKLHNQIDYIFQKSMDVGLPKTGQFNVLNHGDLWTNNILFKYDSKGKPKDAKFVDFQFSVFTSPVVDLQYFICTSPQLETGIKYLSKLLCHYHEHLTTSLRKLNYPNEKIPSYKQIYDDFKDRGFYAIVSAAVALPLVKANCRMDATFDEFRNNVEIETEFRKSCFSNPLYRKCLETFLPMYDDLGLLD